jgi:uncharacterized protein YjaG (DUF416 family)
VLYRFEPVTLKGRLDAIPRLARLAFGVLLLERAIPNFLRFEAETGAPGGGVLRGVQAKLWALLEGSNAVTPFLDITAKECENLAPDTERYSSLYTSSALDAVTIACNVLDFVDSDLVELLVESAGLRRDSVDMFLQRAKRMEPFAADFEVRLLTDPLMQEELGFQEADLTFLTHCCSEGDRWWPTVLRRSIDLGYSNLRMLP